MTFRVMTYNIRACLGLDRDRSIDRIASVIAAESPDIIALQEVDFQRARSGSVNQAAELADRLGLHWCAGESFRDDDGGAYGNAFLARAPLLAIEHAPLPMIASGEPRSVLRSRIALKGRDIDIINTHLSFRRRERAEHMQALCDDDWIGRASAGRRLILCGDLNCGPRDPGFQRLTQFLNDAQLVNRRPKSTWPTRRPFRRLDHILVSPSLTTVNAHTAASAVGRIASDHFPVIADLEF